MINNCYCNKQGHLTMGNVPQPIEAKKVLDIASLPCLSKYIHFNIACNTSMTGRQITLKQIQLKMAVFVWFEFCMVVSSGGGFMARQAPVARNASTSPVF